MARISAVWVAPETLRLFDLDTLPLRRATPPWADRDRAGRSDRIVAARPALVVNLGRDPTRHGRTLSARDKIEERRINRGEHERDTDCLPDAW